MDCEPLTAKPAWQWPYGSASGEDVLVTFMMLRIVQGTQPLVKVKCTSCEKSDRFASESGRWFYYMTRVAFHVNVLGCGATLISSLKHFRTSE